MDKTLAIIIGIIAGVAVIIVFLSFLTRICDRKGTYIISSSLESSIIFFIDD